MLLCVITCFETCSFQQQVWLLITQTLAFNVDRSDLRIRNTWQER